MQENGDWTGNKMEALTLLVLVAIYSLFTQHQECRSGADEDGLASEANYANSRRWRDPDENRTRPEGIDKRL